MEDLDARLAATLDGWVTNHRESLAARGVTILLDGPHDPEGMDPVYMLRLDSARAEAEARLFRGGTLLFAIVDKPHMTVRESHVDATAEPDVTAALASLADNV